MYVVISILFNFFQKINFTLIHFLLPQLILHNKSQLHKVIIKEDVFIDHNIILIQSICKNQLLLQLRYLLIRIIQKDIQKKKKFFDQLLSCFEASLVSEQPLIIGTCWEYGGFNFRYRKK